MQGQRWLLLTLLSVAGCSETLDAEALAKLITQAEQGNVEATHELCYRNIYGSGIPRDYVSALRWCERGARAGLASSQTLLAELYYQGQGVPTDYRRAFEMYLAAAEQGHEHAQYMLYLMHSRGEANALDEAKANDWLRRAAEGGSEHAQRALAKKN